MSIPSSVFCNCLFFPIIDSCSHFARYFYTTRKDGAVHTILLAREETPNLCSNSKLSFQGILLLSSHNLAMCCICHLKSITFTSGRQEEKKPASFVETSFSPFLHKEVYWMVQQWQFLLWLRFCWPNSWFLCPPKPNEKDRDRIWRK